MISNYLVIAFLFNLAFSDDITDNQETKVGVIKVSVTNIRNTNGEMIISLYNQDKGFPNEITSTLENKKLPVQAERLECTFKEIPYGEYAIAIMHDENGNGEMDTNFIGIPAEGVGVSNNALRTFGPPKFKDSKFELNSKELSLEIKTHYY